MRAQARYMLGINRVHGGAGFRRAAVLAESTYSDRAVFRLIAFQGVAEVGSRRFRVGIGRCSW